MNDGHVHAVVATRRERDHITGPEEKRSNTSMDTRREKREVPHTPHESDLYGGEIVNSNEEALHTMIHPFEDHTQIVLSLWSSLLTHPLLISRAPSPLPWGRVPKGPLLNSRACLRILISRVC